MPGHTFRGIGRHRTAEDGQGDFGSGNLFHGSIGYTEGNEHHRRALEADIGVLDSEHLDLITANARLGAWETANGGTQIGGQTAATMFGLDGSIGDIAELFGFGENKSDQGGWQNALDFHADGPSAWAEAHVGSEGGRIGAQASLLSGGATLGGAEYDSFFGTEITGTAAMGGVGGSAGLHWSDDDGDGLREYGLQVGGSWGIGGNVGIKTELPGHLLNAVSDGWDWLTGE